MIVPYTDVLKYKKIISAIPQFNFRPPNPLILQVPNTPVINIDKCILAANITEYHIISKLILHRIIITNFSGSESHLRESTPLDLESPSNDSLDHKSL